MRWQYGDMTNYTAEDFTLDTEIHYAGGGTNKDQQAANQKEDIKPLTGVTIEVIAFPD